MGLGYVLGNHSNASGAKTLRSEGVRVKVPGEWSQVRAPNFAQPLDIDGPVAAAPSPAHSELAIVAGIAAGRGHNLLTPTARGQLAAPVTDQRPQHLGEARGYRLTLRFVGVAWPVRAYVLPTSRGVATVACAITGGDQQQQQTLRACGQAAESLEVRGLKPFQAGPSAQLARKLEGALAALQSRPRLRARLRGAKTSRGQARTAARLASAHGNAAAAVKSTQVGPEFSRARDALASALATAALGYRDLAAAARVHDRRAFAAARRRVRKSEAQARRALRALTVPEPTSR